MYKYGIIAIHGGQIEPGTADIAKSIAGQKFPVYVNYKGRHVMSAEFEDGDFNMFIQTISTVISIHGEKSEDKPFVIVGGLDDVLGTKISSSLEAAGFEVIPAGKGLEGINPHNVCNRGKSGKGVQIEISRKLRDDLLADRNLMNIFSESVRRVLANRMMNLLEWIEEIPDFIFPKLKEHSLTAYFIWREACHLFGSIILLTITYLVSARLFYNLIPYVFVALMVWMSYQEFYLHPQKYGQKLYKGVIDWSAWMLPFILALLV